MILSRMVTEEIEAARRQERGKKLKAIRERKGMTQEQAAFAFGESKSNYSKREQGQRDMAPDFITRACEVFGIRPEDILSEINSSNDPAAGPLVTIDPVRLASLIELSKDRIAVLTTEKARELLLALIEAARKS